MGKLDLPIISAEWLHNHLEDANLILLDATQKKNVAGITTDLEDTQIKGARFFDIKNKFSNQESDLPNTLPSPKQFEEEARKLGINKDSLIVVYDKLGIYSSPRVWWLFKIMGHQKVFVLNGGMPAWVAQDLPTESVNQRDFENGNFVADFRPKMVTNLQKVVNNLETKWSTVIDARSSGRFDGTAPEPRASLSSGHMPGSFSIPYSEVLHNGFFKSKEELIEIFGALNLGKTPLTFTCGSGITACVLYMASEMAIDNKKTVFDGSWTEWASTEGMPIEKEKL